MKTRFLLIAALLALFGQVGLASAADTPAAGAGQPAATQPAPCHLAWQRVGAPLTLNG